MPVRRSSRRKSTTPSKTPKRSKTPTRKKNISSEKKSSSSSRKRSKTPTPAKKTKVSISPKKTSIKENVKMDDIWGRVSLFILTVATLTGSYAYFHGIVDLNEDLPWFLPNMKDHEIALFIYMTVLCLTIQIVVRLVALVIMGSDHPKRGIAPRLATKVVSFLFNAVAVIAGIKGMFHAESSVLKDPIYGRSEHSEFHFSIAAGYFLWATGLNLYYKGSPVAVLQNITQYIICMLTLHPFMHYYGHVFLVGQMSNLVLDFYAIGRLLVRRKSKNLFLQIIHPVVFILARIVLTIPYSVYMMRDMYQLLAEGKSHDRIVVLVFMIGVSIINLLNVSWVLSSILNRKALTGRVFSTDRSRLSNVKWFAVNLNWFDIGVTLVFGDLQEEKKKKLNITNSSYRYAYAGRVLPISVAVIALLAARALADQLDSVDNVRLTLLSSVAVLVVWITDRIAKIGFVVQRDEVLEESMGTETLYHKIPNKRRLVDQIKVRYHNDSTVSRGGDNRLLSRILASTPLPKGKSEFSSIHVVVPPKSLKSKSAEAVLRSLQIGNATLVRKPLHTHRLDKHCTSGDATDEYRTIFTVCSDMILSKADRASIVIFVGWEDPVFDFYAAAIGMLPFRGITTALVTQRKSYGDLLYYQAPSTVFEINGSEAARMGMFPIKAVFGSLHDKTLVQAVDEWDPVDISPFVNHSDQINHPAVHLPFKIGALTLPMLTHNGSYENAIDALGQLLKRQHGAYFPIVSCGETCDALGYGEDILRALNQKRGYYFNHRSGETFKCWENYGSAELFDCIASAKEDGLPIVVVAVGGGVNGNCIGLISACTNTHLVEVPTTPMHYNDATTSAKKAFSLVKNDKILSKNIMGAFYIPELVFCVSETFITLSTANVHATVGEACKTMNMLGMTNTKTGARDYYNIEGAIEFASDYTKIVKHVDGFDALIEFIEDSETRALKKAIIDCGSEIRDLSPKSKKRSELVRERKKMIDSFRARYYDLGESKVTSIKTFLSVVNKEIVKAKAMFLSYSDPFEKYRALLFEYAHTLGHGVEAFCNLAYTMARQRGIEVPEEAIRLHGQCVGMAVLWAGQMSFDLGELKGDGFALHQGFVYLFNRHGGFDFSPVVRLFDTLGITKEQFCEGVLEVVRRDNKRGYCKCSDESKSVDQLVTGRPGKMMRSANINAELRYLVEVDEDWQKRVLGQAFDGYFDNVADIDEHGKLIFKKRQKKSAQKKLRLTSASGEVGSYIHNAVSSIYR